jgi:hypothetical protein
MFWQIKFNEQFASNDPAKLPKLKNVSFDPGQAFNRLRWPKSVNNHKVRLGN